MSSTNIQVILDLLIKAEGGETLAPIIKGLQQMVDVGGEGAESAKKVLDEFAKIGQQNNLVSALTADKAALHDIGDSLTLAKLKVKELQEQMTASAAPAAGLAREFTKANASVAGLETQYTALGVSIQRGDLALRAAGVDTANLDSEQRRLQADLAATTARATGLAVGFKESAAAAKAESLSLGEVAERSAILRTGFEQLRDLLKTFAGLFALEKVGEEIHDILNTGDKFQKWGQQFAAAFGGAEQGQAALEKVKELAEATPFTLDEITAAALQAKKEGLDPFNGSLLALINTTVKFGGTGDDLKELVKELGRAANEGALNIGTLTKLEQEGVPASQLLADALGKTKDEILDLARNGKLGTESVQALIGALGKANTGAITDQMGLLSTQTTKAKDNFDEFLNLIAKSGAYDFVREQLAALNVEFKKGLEDGTLQESAKAISDGLIKIGQALLSITKFATEHAGAIVTVVEQYALFRGAMLALDLVGAAQKMLGLASATATAGAAAEAAAVGGGFGKLGAAINAIPKTVQIGVAIIGAIDVLVQLKDILDLEQQNIDLHLRMQELQKEDEAQQQRLLAAARLAQAANKQAVDQQIASAEQLSEKNREQTAQYVESLKSAITFFEAVKIQDKAIGDADGTTKAAARVRAFIIALADAKKHQEEVADAITKSSERVNAAVERFDVLRSHGESAASAIQGAFNRIDLSNPKGIQDAIAVIEQVSIRSKEAAAAVRTELSGALAKLNETDLRAFQQNVSQQLADAKGNAQALKEALGAALQVELQRLGLTAQQAGVQFTDAGQAIIASFTGMAQNAQATSAQIQLAFAQALTKVTTTGEVEALKTQLRSLFDAGRISAGQFQIASEAAGRKLAGIQTDAAKAGAALDGMGKQGETAAQRISSSLQDARDKLVVQANQIAAAIAAAMSGGDFTKAEQLKAQFKGIDAQVQALNDQINQLTPSFADAGTAGQRSGQQISDSFDQATSAADRLRGAASQADDALQGTGRSAGDLSQEVQDIGTGGFPNLTQAIADTRAGFLSISQEATDLFDKTFEGLFKLGNDATGIGFKKVADALAGAAAKVTGELANSRTELQGLIDEMDSAGAAGTDAFGNINTSIGGTLGSLEAFKASLENGTTKVGILGQQDLGPLLAAIDGAISRTQTLASEAQDAKDKLAGLIKDVNDAFAPKDEVSQENRRFQEQIDNLKAAAKEAGKLNDLEFLRAIEKAKKLHADNLKDIEDEQKAKDKGSNPTPTGGGAASASGGNRGDGLSNIGGGSGGLVINLHLHTDGATIIGGNRKQVAKDLLDPMVDELKQLQQRSTGDILGRK